jgi:hypothetical protein
LRRLWQQTLRLHTPPLQVGGGIAVFSDPLFRKNLGERYLNPFSLMGLGLLWLIALTLSWPFGLSITGMVIIRGDVANTHWVSKSDTAI